MHCVISTSATLNIRMTEMGSKFQVVVFLPLLYYLASKYCELVTGSVECHCYELGKACSRYSANFLHFDAIVLLILDTPYYIHSIRSDC